MIRQGCLPAVREALDPINRSQRSGISDHRAADNVAQKMIMYDDSRKRENRSDRDKSPFPFWKT